MRPLLISLLFILIFQIMPENGNAQTNPAQETDLDKKVKEAEANKKIAEAKYAEEKAKKDAEALNAPLTDKEKALRDKEIAVAEKEAALAKRDLYKGPEVTPPSGKITSTGDFIESRILAKKSLETILGQSVDALATKLTKPTTLVIYNATDIPAMELYASMIDGLEGMNKAFTRANKAAKDALETENKYESDVFILSDPLLLGFAAGGILRTAADIVSLFKTSTEFKNFDVAIDEMAFISVFAQTVMSKKTDWKVFHPSLYPVDAFNIKTNKTSALAKALDDIKGLSTIAEQRIAAIEAKIASIKEAMSTEKDKNKKRRMQKHIDLFEPMLASVKSLVQSFTQLQTTLSTVDPTTKLTAQALLLRAERLVTKLNQDDCYMVKLSVVAKGSNKIKESLFKTSASITHSGGAEVSIMVFQPDGQLIFAETRSHYSPYTAPDKIK
jgi:hypothetical protein